MERLPHVTKTKKFCNGCNRWKKHEKFGKSSKSKHGLHWQCKECINKKNKEKYARDPSMSIALSAAYQRKQRQMRDDVISGKAASVPARMKRELGSYGITVDEFLRLQEKQEGRCAICGKTPDEAHGHRSRRLYIDHCHDTGEVRGLLCSRCNVGIGYFYHSRELITRACDYLERHLGASRDAEEQNSEPIGLYVSVQRKQHGNKPDMAHCPLAD